MTLAIAVTLCSVGLGVALGLLGTRRLGAIRSFAVAAAAALSAVHLIPDGVAVLGVGAIALFFVALWLPGALGHAAHRARARAESSSLNLGLELSYAALLLHSFGDGVALGAYSGPAHADHTHLDVLLAVGAHTVPVVAAFMLSYGQHRSPKQAALRALTFAGATLLGLVATALIAPEVVTELHGYFGPIVAGLLLHVVSHDGEAEHPRALGARAAHLVAAGLGIAVTLIEGHAHEPAAEHAAHELLDGFVAWLLVTSPALLAGLAVRALLGVMTSRGRALGFASLPRSVRPLLAPEASLLIAVLFGVHVAVIVLAVGLLLASILGGTADRAPGAGSLGAAETESSVQRFALELVRAASRSLPWYLAGLLFAALLNALAESVRLVEAPLVWQCVGALSLAALLPLPPLASAPALFVSLSSGLHGAPAWLVLVAAWPLASAWRGLASRPGPANSPRRRLVAGAAALVLAGLVAVIAPLRPTALPAPSTLQLACALALAVLALVLCWREGPRGFLDPVVHPR